MAVRISGVSVGSAAADAIGVTETRRANIDNAARMFADTVFMTVVKPD
jgi:hypothetical protein